MSILVNLLSSDKLNVDKSNLHKLNLYPLNLDESNLDELNLDELNLESELRTALDRLQLGDFQTRWEAAKTIANLGDAAIEPLLTILEEEDADWELLWFVARILGNLNHPSVVSALVNLIKTNNNAEVTSMAATALTQYGVAAIAALSELIQDNSTRFMAVQSLVQIRHVDVVPPLLSVLSDSSPAIRATAIEALSHYYDPAISAALLTGLDDLNPTVRRAAVVGLGIQAQQADQSDQPRLTESLKQRLWDFDLEVCNQAAIALGRVGTNAAADALLEVLRSVHTPLPLKLEAIRALAWMDTLYALTCLQELLQLVAQDSSASLPLTQEVLTVLGRVESVETKTKASAMLLDLLSSGSALVQDSRQKQTIALSLGQLGQPQAIEALIRLLSDADASVRFHAIAALKQLDAETAFQRLQTLAASETITPELRSGVSIALQEWNR